MSYIGLASEVGSVGRSGSASQLVRDISTGRYQSEITGVVTGVAMNKNIGVSDSILTLPVVVGVLVVVGGIAALGVSGLFVWRAQAVKAETQRLQALLEAKQAAQLHQQLKIIKETAPSQLFMRSARDLASSAKGLSANDIIEATEELKPGVRLQAARRVQWDQAEIVELLENEKIKVRWLSGEPGEDVIASDLVRADDLPSP